MAFFEDLEVWQDARTLTLSIYQMMSNNNDYGFRDQIQRAAVSIMNNIAEGSESGSNATNIPSKTRNGRQYKIRRTDIMKSIYPPRSSVYLICYG